MEFGIPLPTNPHEVESKILSICGHYGYNAVIDVKDGQLMIQYDETPEMENFKQSGSTRPKC